MSRSLGVLSAFVAALLTTTAPAPVGATTFDKLTYLTFSGPVQVPGVTLDAGTYRFRLANPESSRNIIQVLSHDGSAVYAMFHTMPDRRTEITDQAVVTFKETPAGVPVAVKSLFYGGEYRGYEFVYPSAGPNMRVADRPQPEITYTAMPSSAAPVAEPAPLAPAMRTPAPLPYEAVASPVQAELPRTATRLPWVTVGGFASLVLGLGVGLLRRHVN